MKRIISLTLFACIIFSFTLPLYASGEEILATSSIELSYGHVKSADGIYLDGSRVYAGYEDVLLTGMNSIEIKAVNQFTLTHEGEVILVRLDSAKGKVIGRVYIEKDTGGKVETFKGAIEPTNGVHRVYLMSTIATTNLKSTKIVSFKFSEEKYVEENTYVPTPDSAITDTHPTTWALTDTLGRKMATYAEAGPVREGKYVGIFYHIWHWGRHKTLNYSEFMKEYPEARFDYYHPAWPTVTTSHFWNEPLFGYYSNQDYWVYRKHAEMLSAAGVDFVAFDCSNVSVSMRHPYEVFLTAMTDAKKDGVNTPKVTFLNAIRKQEGYEKVKAMKLYFDMYSRGKYSDHWFYWEGKPLLLTYPESLKPESGDAEEEKLFNEIKDFFTFRKNSPGADSASDEPDYWTWLSVYPQNPFGKNPDGTWEMMVVSPAANYSYVHKMGSALNSLYSTGRSYTELLGEDKSPGAYMYGYNFNEKMRRLLEVDPEIMWITGWNEWTAGRSASGRENLNAIVDTFDDEHSRDFEPSKGPLGDVYYCLMVDAIRKFKGVEETPLASAPKTIDINDLSSWDNVGPEFLNWKGTYQRNYVGYNGTNNTNYTQRNNVVKALVSRDEANLYFYAECEKDITKPQGDSWMKLYIDIDRNHATGWEGYDYVINYPVAGVVSLLSGDGTATETGRVEYVLNGKTLVIKVPKSLVGAGSVIDMEFKWVDNAKGDILNFYVDGKSAPLGRFNFVYTEIPEVYATKETKNALKGVTVAGKNSPFAYIEGKKTYMYEPDTRYKSEVIDGVTYVPAYFLYDALNYKVIYEPERNMFKLMGEKKIYTTAGDKAVRIDGRLNYMTNPVLILNGIAYLPETFFSEVLGLEVYSINDRFAFGNNIDKTAVESLVF